MKRIRLCATVLGLLTCAAVAKAQTVAVTINVSQNGNPVSGADVVVNGVRGQTDANGSLQMILNFSNNPNKAVEITVDQCDDNPPITYVAVAGAPTPPPEPDCRRKKPPAAILITGPGTLRVRIGPEGVTASFTPAPGAGGGGGEGHAPVTFEASFSGGFTHASNLSSTSALEGDVTVYFGPFGGGGGVFRTGNVTGQQATGAPPGGSLPTSVTNTTHVDAAEFFASVKPLDLGRFKLVFIGGGMPFTARETSTGTVVVTNPTSGTTTLVITSNTEKGGVAPYFGGRVQVLVTKWLAGEVTVKRIYLRSDNSLNQGITVITFGGSVSPDFSRGFWQALK